MDSYSIILKPIRSEKSYAGIANKKYVFSVKTDATKTQIKIAVEQVFGVKVKSVNTINCRGKFKRQGRTSGYTAATKKAIVQLTDESPAIKEFEGLA